MSFHDCLRSAPHATLAGRRLLHFIVWVFSLAFLMLMFMFNDCGPDSCDHKRHRECVAMAFQHHACWGQDLLWPELLQCGKKATESHLSTCVILANINAGIQSRHQVVLHVKVFFHSCHAWPSDRSLISFSVLSLLPILDRSLTSSASEPHNWLYGNRKLFECHDILYCKPRYSL